MHGVGQHQPADPFPAVSHQRLAAEEAERAYEEAFRLDMLSRGLSFYLCVAVSGVITLLGYAALHRREHKKERKA